MALLADDSAHRARQMIALTERLSALVEADIAAIDAHQPLPMGEIAEEKARLANAYRSEMALIERDPTRLAGLPVDLKAELRAATERFQALLDAYEAKLRIVKELSEGLVQALAEEVRRQRGAQAGYGAEGGYRDAAAAGVAIDRQA